MVQGLSNGATEAGICQCCRMFLSITQIDIKYLFPSLFTYFHISIPDTIEKFN